MANEYWDDPERIQIILETLLPTLQKSDYDRNNKLIPTSAPSAVEVKIIVRENITKSYTKVHISCKNLQLYNAYYCILHSRKFCGLISIFF